MAAAGFNDSFWVAVAAAAPVIGLASVVAMERVARSIVRYGEQREKMGKAPLPQGNPVAALRIAVGNVGVQALALGIALTNLSDRADVMPRTAATIVTAAGLAAVAVGVIVTTGPLPGSGGRSSSREPRQ